MAPSDAPAHADASRGAAAVDQVDTSYLEGLLGYNARRASLAIIDVFLQRMAAHKLRPVDFSVLSLIHHNPGITSRQLCGALSLQPPNLVGMLNTHERRGLLRRQPHPSDGRALGLHLSAKGRALMQQAEQTASELEAEAASRLRPQERQTLMRLLRKLYA